MRPLFHSRFSHPIFCWTLWGTVLWVGMGHVALAAAATRKAAPVDPGRLALGGGVLLLMIVISTAIYFAPTIIGIYRGVPQLGPLIIVNVFLGWSLIGWVVALAWSFASVRTRSRYVSRSSPVNLPGQSPRRDNFDWLKDQ